ncbi:hypothetical protein J6590_012832 [Homalodisca vitripennis]|nr:hypothetical protein J6590_012832 [Homalodisca vitripennis]
MWRKRMENSSIEYVIYNWAETVLHISLATTYVAVYLSRQTCFGDRKEPPTGAIIFGGSNPGASWERLGGDRGRNCQMSFRITCVHLSQVLITTAGDRHWSSLPNISELLAL